MVAEGPLAGRHAWIDTLRLFAGISMIGLHVTADAQGQPFPEATAAERVVPMLLRTVLYTARTELFLIVSLLLLLMAQARHRRSYGVVMRDQARRLLVPFVFWTVFYAGFGLIKAQAFGYGAAQWERVISVQGWLGFLLLGDVKYHMHFIPTLFGLVLMYPAYQSARKQPVWGFLILAFLFLKSALEGEIYPLLWGGDALPYVMRAVKILTYAGYGFLAGAVLGLWERSSAQVRAEWFAPLALLAAALFAVKLLATVQVVMQGRWDLTDPAAYWADYMMPAVLLLLCLSRADRSWPCWSSRLARYTFGLYLCHPMFLDLAEIALRDSTLSPTALMVLELLWTLPMTGLAVWGLAGWRGTAWTVGLGPLPGMGRRLKPQDI